MESERQDRTRTAPCCAFSRNQRKPGGKSCGAIADPRTAGAKEGEPEYGCSCWKYLAVKVG